jgi:DNA-binding PadR family transcriptional regulator
LLTRLRTAWLLHLLDEHPTHGYRVERELGALEVNTKLTGIYRTLRDLQRDGWASSDRTVRGSDSGRRVYQLTPMRRRELDAITEQIARVRDCTTRSSARTSGAKPTVLAFLDERRALLDGDL